MTHNDVDRELQQLYRSHARNVNSQEFTDALGERLAKARARSIMGLTPRRTALIVLSLAIVAGLVVGGLQAMQHLSGPSPVLVLGEPVQPGEGDQPGEGPDGPTDPTLPATTVTTLAPDEAGSESVDEPSASPRTTEPPQGAETTQAARELADAVVERFAQLEVALAVETRDGEWTLTTVELITATESGGATVSIQVFGPDQPVSDEGSTSTTLVPSDDPAEVKPTVTHPRITGADATYLIEYPGGSMWQLIAKFPDDKEINVTSAAADSSSGAAPLDGDQLIEVVELLVKMLY